MNIVEILSSVNKLAIGAFLVTLAFIVYEGAAVLRAGKKNKKPVVPDFIEGKNTQQTVLAVQVSETTPMAKQKHVKKRSTIVIIIPVALLAMATFVVGVSIYNSNTTSVRSAESATDVRYVLSSGIEIYDAQWQKVDAGQLGGLTAGDTIYIGVATIPHTQIDKARIRVGQDVWTSDTETSAFNQDLRIFYRQFNVPEGQAGLKIEAELHAPEKGWLGGQGQ